MDNFKEVNEIYAQYFKKVQPARSMVAVSKLPLDAKVEIEATFFKKFLSREQKENREQSNNQDG